MRPWVGGSTRVPPSCLLPPLVFLERIQPIRVLSIGIFPIGVIAITRWLTLDFSPNIPLITKLAYRRNIKLLEILVKIDLQLLIILIWGELRFPLGLLGTIRQLGSRLSLVARLGLISRLRLGSNLNLRTGLGLEPRLGLKTRWRLRSNNYLGAQLSRPRLMSLRKLRMIHLVRSLTQLRLGLAHLPKRLSLLGSGLPLQS